VHRLLQSNAQVVTGACCPAPRACGTCMPSRCRACICPRAYVCVWPFITTGNSSFHRGVARDGEPFTLAMLEASVNETQGLGVDIHELAPGCCFVPWWNNASVISIPDHVKWWTTTFNNGALPPNRTEGFMEYDTRHPVCLMRVMLHVQDPTVRTEALLLFSFLVSVNDNLCACQCLAH
jgi:hypothetical protein